MKINNPENIKNLEMVGKDLIITYQDGKSEKVSNREYFDIMLQWKKFSMDNK